MFTVLDDTILMKEMLSVGVVNMNIRTSRGRLLAFSDPGQSRFFLLLAFIVIASVFVGTSAAVLYRSKQIRRATQTIVEDALASVDLVSRMGLDVSRERRLVSMHILEKEEIVMSRLEAQIGGLETDFAGAAAAYEPLTTEPGERTAWLRLQADHAAIRTPIARLLALSRKNRDVEAREDLHSLEGQFGEISEDVDTLIRINREQAERQVQGITAMQSYGSNLQMVLTSIGVAATVIVGWWAIHLIGLREEQLTRYSLLLETRNRDLDAFAGRVAHDLRGPLSTIGLAVFQLSELAPGAQKTIAILQRGVNRMESLIADLLALSRIGADRAVACDPAAVAAQICEDLSSRLEGGGIMRVEVASAKVLCVEGLLRQALWNLADNAIKYRRADVPLRIEIAGHPSDHKYELTVADNGTGMSRDESQKAFDPFYRAHPTRETPGTGLGLSIVKRVIEASGGTISIYSQPGGGTTFIIHLPLAPDDEEKIKSA